VIKQLQAKYYNKHGILATLTGMFQGSTNIQQIVSKLLAPFTEHWHRDLKDKYFRCVINKYNRTIVKFLYKIKMLLFLFQRNNDSCTICFKNESSLETIEFHGTQYLLKHY